MGNFSRNEGIKETAHAKPAHTRVADLRASKFQQILRKHYLRAKAAGKESVRCAECACFDGGCGADAQLIKMARGAYSLRDPDPTAKGACAEYNPTNPV